MRSLEVPVAQVIEEVLLRDHGRAVGPRTTHDYNDGVRLAVDFTYDDAAPPMALEITALHDAPWLEIRSLSDKLARELSAIAERERLGAWDITAWDSGRVRDMREPILDVMRMGHSVTQDYTNEDLDAWEDRGDLDRQTGLRSRLAAAGIDEVLIATRASGVAVSSAGFSKRTTPRWPGADLSAIVASNSAKLRAPRMEAHLAVAVGKFHVSTSAQDWVVPVLPSHITRIWLVHLWTPVGRANQVWSAGRGDTTWTLHAPTKVG